MPIDIGAAMSRVFSITIMTTDIRMFAPATNKINPHGDKHEQAPELQGMEKKLVSSPSLS